MTMMFCVSCPLITPFGCMYFITKHYVDRHNIFYVYKPSKINKRVHATAISFVILSTVVLQFFMTIFRLVFTALWLPIYYLCVHHVILANCWILKLASNVEIFILFSAALKKNNELLGKFCFEITQPFLNLEGVPKCISQHSFWKDTATKIIWYSTPISTFNALSKWHDTCISNDKFFFGDFVIFLWPSNFIKLLYQGYGHGKF